MNKPFGLTTLHTALQDCFSDRNSVRKHLRTNYNRDVLVEHEDSEKKYLAISLSEGGVYLRANNPFPVDSEVIVKVTLSTGNVVELTGRVIYVVRLSSGTFVIPPGMAVQFLEDSNELINLMLLSYEIERLLIGDIVEEQDEKSPTFVYRNVQNQIDEVLKGSIG